MSAQFFVSTRPLRFPFTFTQADYDKVMITSATGNVETANLTTAQINALGNQVQTTGAFGNALELGNVVVSDLTASGNITASYLLGDGSLLTGMTGAAPTSLDASIIQSGTLDNARLPANITGNGAALTSLNASQLSEGTVPSARLAGAYAAITNLTASGTVSANQFVGNITATSVTTSNIRRDDTPMVTYGSLWVSRPTGVPVYGWTGVTWGGPAGSQVFVAVADPESGIIRVMTSPDGITWTSRTSAAAANNSWTSVTWGGPAGSEVFVAVAGSGTGNRVMTSPDGIVWTSRTSASNNIWTSVTWGGPAGSEVFVAVASYSGTGNRVMTSPDGIVWTSRTSAADNNWAGVTWGGPTGSELFVAVAAQNGGLVMTSPDGIVWTLRSTNIDKYLRAVAWGGPSGSQVFVAVAYAGGVITSPDGITWTGRDTGLLGSSYHISWGGGSGTFVATFEEDVYTEAGAMKMHSRLITSPDGITWTPQSTDIDAYFTGVTWGGPAGSELFVALGSPTGGVTTSSAIETYTPVSVSRALTVQGHAVGRGGGGVSTNFAAGSSALESNLNGSENVGVGAYALTKNTTGSLNTACGPYALRSNTTGIRNTAVGMNALLKSVINMDNTAVGTNALQHNTDGFDPFGYLSFESYIGFFVEGNRNTACGANALQSNTTGYENAAFGYNALAKNEGGFFNTAFGSQCLPLSIYGSRNAAYGMQTMYCNTSGSFNSAYGPQCLTQNTTGGFNIAVGYLAMQSNTTGSQNTSIGAYSLRTNTTGILNTACGYNALGYTISGTASQTFSNSSGLGNDTRVSASNQVQLGNAATTTYVYGTVNNRSDARDKTDIRDTILGLDFIEKLRPVDYRWDMRDDYLEKVTRIESIKVRRRSGSVVTELDAEADPAAEPIKPVVEPEPGTYDILVNDQVTARITYPGGTIELVDPSKEYDSDTLVATCPALPDLKLKVKTRSEMKTIEKDGSKKRNRYHHGLIAQEVESVLQESGVDFGGFQHHSVGGGEDIYTIGYAELFGPLIKAVQELAAENKVLKGDNSALKNDVAAIKAHIGLT